MTPIIISEYSFMDLLLLSWLLPVEDNSFNQILEYLLRRSYFEALETGLLSKKQKFSVILGLFLKNPLNRIYWKNKLNKFPEWYVLILIYRIKWLIFFSIILCRIMHIVLLITKCYRAK